MTFLLTLQIEYEFLRRRHSGAGCVQFHQVQAQWKVLVLHFSQVSLQILDLLLGTLVDGGTAANLAFLVKETFANPIFHQPCSQFVYMETFLIDRSHLWKGAYFQKTKKRYPPIFRCNLQLRATAAPGDGQRNWWTYPVANRRQTEEHWRKQEGCKCIFYAWVNNLLYS